jgi:UDP-3-O-acyl-N-acetylglucosamine deacetylase
MSLLSKSFIGHITAYRSGHNLNTRLASAILSCKDKWVEVGLTEEDIMA